MAACLPFCFTVSFPITSHFLGRWREEGVEREWGVEREIWAEREREKERERERERERAISV